MIYILGQNILGLLDFNLSTSFLGHHNVVF